MLTASGNFVKFCFGHIHQYGVLCIHFRCQFATSTTNANNLHDFMSSRNDDDFVSKRSLANNC